MYCNQCGRKNLDSAKFCTGCGAKLKQSVSQNENPSSEPVNDEADQTVSVFDAESPFKSINPNECSGDTPGAEEAEVLTVNVSDAEAADEAAKSNASISDAPSEEKAAGVTDESDADTPLKPIESQRTPFPTTKEAASPSNAADTTSSNAPFASSTPKANASASPFPSIDLAAGRSAHIDNSKEPSQENTDAFAHDLPEWSITPPSVMVRRKQRKRA